MTAIMTWPHQVHFHLVSTAAAAATSGKAADDDDNHRSSSAVPYAAPCPSLFLGFPHIFPPSASCDGHTKFMCKGKTWLRSVEGSLPFDGDRRSTIS